MSRDRSTRPQAKPLRLFVAVDPPVEVVAGLAAAVAPFREGLPGARWTRSEGWHVTLKFVGSTSPRLVPTVEGAVRSAAARVAPFDTWLMTVGAFPSPHRARVLWAGLDAAEGRFAELVNLLDDLLADVISPENRAFTPHLTLARIDPPTRLTEVAPALLALDVTSKPFAVDRLILYRSHLSPKGATYEPMVVSPLLG